MMDLASMLQNAMGSSFPMVQTVNNHAVPLHFETYGGTVHDGRIQDVGFGATAAMEAHVQLAEDFRSPEVMRAALIALGAHDHLPGQRGKARREALKALQVSPICPEAHNVLALCSDSLEEALEQYSKAEELGPQVCPPERLQEELKNGDLWLRLWARPYLRGLFGVGNTLRKLGRYEEALPKYERLCQLSSRMHATGPFITWFAHLPELWLRVHGPQGCLTRMFRAKKVQVTCIEYTSSQVCWLYGMALAQFASGQVREYRPAVTSRGPNDEGVVWEQAWGGSAAIMAVDMAPTAAEYLLGELPMPSNPLPRYLGPCRSHAQGALYAHMCGDQWRSTPGALDFLRRIRNTQQVATAVFKHVHDGETLDENWVLSRIEDGIFPNAAVTPAAYFGGTILTSICALSSTGLPGLEQMQARLVRAVLRQGVDPKQRGPIGLTALCQAAYYAAGPEVVRLLLEAGFDPLEEVAQPGSPLEDRFQNPLSMTANQGNARELDAILTHSPQLCSRLAKGFRPASSRVVKAPVLELLLYSTLESSCLSCVAGGVPCQRCEQGDGKHSPHCSFHACVEVLVKHGLRSSQQMREHFKALLGFALPQNRRYIRDVIERFEAASRAAQAGGGSGSSRSAGGAAQAAQGSSACAAARAAPSSSGGGPAGQATYTKRCTECGTVKGKLLRCSGCKQLWYCSRECQLANWPAHKAACRAVQHPAKQAAA
ncbi:hypothetical protein ABPG77_006248 [Micractinium sp. CCAP 211/92]